MKKIVAIVITLVILGVIATISGGKLRKVDSTDYLKGISFLGNSSFRFQMDEKVIYFDPVGVKGEPQDADIIFITHSHNDHMSLADLKKVKKENTIVVATTDLTAWLRRMEMPEVVEVTPLNKYEVGGVQVETVPAYNIDKEFHKRDKDWVGYIVTINGVRYYMAGDTDLIPEMENIQADVVFLPVDGTFTMTAEKAAEAANMIKPKVAVPIHYGSVAGSIKDAELFIEKLDKPIKGIILEKE